MPSNTTKVHKISAFNIFSFPANGTGPIAIRYAGPEYLIHNEAKNCTKGIEKPENNRVTVFETCEVNDYSDPRLASWVAVGNQTAAFDAPPQIKRSRTQVYVYCPLETIKFGSLRQQNCPTKVMRISVTQPFTISNYNHVTRVVNFNTSTYVPSVKDAHVNATLSEAVYDYYHESIRRAKQLNGKAIELVGKMTKPDEENGFFWMATLGGPSLLRSELGAEYALLKVDTAAISPYALVNRTQGDKRLSTRDSWIAR